MCIECRVLHNKNASNALLGVSSFKHTVYGTKEAFLTTAGAFLFNVGFNKIQKGHDIRKETPNDTNSERFVPMQSLTH